MTTALIVGDVHGNIDLLAGLLRQEGILDDGNDRIDGDTMVVQIGDLCNCVADSRDEDLACLAFAADWLDVYLVGNHEHPYFGGPTFFGFKHYDRVGAQLRIYESMGLVQPCVAVDGVLASHAGLARRRFRSGLTTAEEFARNTRGLWRDHPANATFSAISRDRGGSDEEGGILWSHWTEPKLLGFSQVVGHTPGDEIRWQRHGSRFAVCIDLGAALGRNRIAGCWLRDGKPEVVIYEDAVST